MFVVTGANGFIGSAMVWELNQAGINDIICVDAVDLDARPNVLKPLKYADFFTHTTFLKNLSLGHFTDIKAIFHMGACSSTTETNKDYLTEINLEYTKSIFQYCTKNNIPLIYASSGAVYGDGQLGFDDTTDPKKYIPLNLYGWSKSEFDIWALNQEDTPKRWYGLRFFNVYGPNEFHKGSMSSVVYKASQQIKQAGHLKLFKSHNSKYKDGEQLRDFVYVKDITRWMLEIYENQNVKNGIYNMGYGEARTWIDLAKCIFTELNLELNIQWIDIPENIRNQYQYYTKAKMDKLLSQGLSQPQWPIEKGVKDYIQNHLITDVPRHLNTN